MRKKPILRLMNPSQKRRAKHRHLEIIHTLVAGGLEVDGRVVPFVDKNLRATIDGLNGEKVAAYFYACSTHRWEVAKTLRKDSRELSRSVLSSTKTPFDAVGLAPSITLAHKAPNRFAQRMARGSPWAILLERLKVSPKWLENLK